MRDQTGAHSMAKVLLIQRVCLEERRCILGEGLYSESLILFPSSPDSILISSIQNALCLIFVSWYMLGVYCNVPQDCTPMVCRLFSFNDYGCTVACTTKVPMSLLEFSDPDSKHQTLPKLVNQNPYTVTPSVTPVGVQLSTWTFFCPTKHEPCCFHLPFWVTTGRTNNCNQLLSLCYSKNILCQPWIGAYDESRKSDKGLCVLNTLASLKGEFYTTTSFLHKSAGNPVYPLEFFSRE